MLYEKYRFFITAYLFITSWITKSQENRDSSACRAKSKWKRQTQSLITFLTTMGTCCGAVVFTLILYLTENWDSKIRKSFTRLMYVQTFGHLAYTFLGAKKIRESNATRQLLYLDTILTGSNSYHS